jgi:tetratricopeptide (TPR) repeat protein
MTDPRPDIPSWTRSPWIKWSWLLVLVVVIAQSLDYQWRALPTSATGYYARGRADYMARRYGSAVDNLTKSIAREPEDAEGYILRGKAYARLQDLAHAMPDLRRALELRPDYEKAHAAFADGKATAWDAQSAIDAYSRAIALDPTYGRYSLERGKLLYDTGRLDDAAADLRRAATVLLGEDQVTAYLLLWVARARAGEAFGATAELTGVMAAGRIHGERFWSNARFLCGGLAEPAHLAALNALAGDDVGERKAEGFFLAGAKRLAFGDRRGGLTLMRDALRTGADASYAYDRARVELESLLLGFHPIRIEETEHRLVASSVTPGGPADASGIRSGSVLARIGGAEAGRDAFLTFLASAEPGSTVEVQVVKGAGPVERMTLSVTPDSSEPTR